MLAGVVPAESWILRNPVIRGDLSGSGAGCEQWAGHKIPFESPVCPPEIEFMKRSARLDLPPRSASHSRAALKHALDYLDSLHRTPVGPSADIATLRARFEKPLKDEGIPSEQVISELVDDAKGGIIGSTGSRFYALGDRRLCSFIGRRRLAHLRLGSECRPSCPGSRGCGG